MADQALALAWHPGAVRSITTRAGVVRWGVWTHVALLNDGRQASTLVNGELVASTWVDADDDAQAAVFNANADGYAVAPGSFVAPSPCALVIGGAGTGVGSAGAAHADAALSFRCSISRYFNEPRYWGIVYDRNCDETSREISCSGWNIHNF